MSESQLILVEGSRSGSSVSDYDDTPLFTRRIYSHIKSSHEMIKVAVNSRNSRTIGMKKDIPLQPRRVSHDCKVKFQKSAMATILEDFFQYLRILDGIHNGLRILMVTDDIELELRKKFGVEDTKSPDVEVDRHSDLGSRKYKLEKMVADRKYIYQVLSGTYLELVLEKTFSTLTRANSERIARTQYFQKLTEEINRHKIIKRDLTKQIRHQRNNFKTELYNLDGKITSIQARLEDATFLTEIESRYVGHWELARTEQHKQIISNNEDRSSKAINEYRKKYDTEMQIHANVDLAMSILITDTLDKIDDLMTKYDEDHEKIEVEIQIKKGDVQELIEKREEMEKIFETHQKEIEDWIQVKENREKERLYREKMTAAAITIQAWWRGLETRLQLGPYKYKPKKRKPKRKQK